MSFSFRDKGRLSDRLRGKTCDEILKELREHINQDRNMSFDSSPSWGGFPSGPAFPRAGFPFMDQDMMSRPDMRARFEDLANRHPEFAEHLRPTAWGTVPETDPHFFQSAAPGPSLYRQRHPSGGSGPGTASFGEANAIPIPVIHEDSGGGESGSARGRTRKIPQYGMRNTVDLGESQKLNPSDTNEDLRSQRSWSAPPDNRARGEDPQPKRFVTRVDVNNSHCNPGGDNDPASANPASNSGPGKPPPFPKASGPGPTQQPASKSSNVRHIPIFVEGRDEPVMPKTPDNHSFSSSRSSSGSSSGFGQPNASYAFASATPGNHSSAFASAHSTPGRGWSQASGPHPHGSTTYQPGSSPNPNVGVPHPHGGFPPTQGSAPHPPGNVPPPQGAAHHGPKPEAPVHTPKQIVPKDPIAKVKAVQEEVDELRKLVDKFSGSRNDKEYIYLDEMLTRNLIKLDDIETEGKDNIRQVRKDAIRSIQKCISILESKAPSPQESKTEVSEGSVPAECTMEENNEDVVQDQATQQDTNAGLEVNEVPMEVQEKADGLDQSNPDASTAVNDAQMMTEPEKEMEVTGDEQTDEKVGEVPSSSVVENTLPEVGGQDFPAVGQELPSEGVLAVEPSQEAEVMEVVPTTEEKGEVGGEDLTKANMEVSTDGKENESIANDGANVVVVGESCDVRPDPVCDTSNKDDNASGDVTEKGVVEKVANVPTDNRSTETGEAPAVVEDAKSCANEQPIPIDTPNEGSVASKDSEVTVGQPSTGDIKSNEATPSEVTNKEVS